MRFMLAGLIYPMAQAVLFGAGLLAASLLGLTPQSALTALVHVALASLVLAAPIAWEIAPCLLSRRERDDLMK